MRRYVALLGITAALALGASAAYLLPHGLLGVKPPAFANQKQEGAYWEARIRAIGGAAAYQELVRYNKGRAYDQGHSSAHLFGGALFRTEGDAGLSVCDAHFSYGCFHEFLGEAISTEGQGVIEKLNQGCIDALPETFLSCQHGIGHGILASLGYSYDDLTQALTRCKNLSHADPIGGCYGGVFMEYNFQTMLLEEGRVRRPENGNLLSPCDTLDATFLPACYFWHPQWLVAVLGKEPTTFTRMGELCRQAPTPDIVRACFEGVGEIAPEASDFKASGALMRCQAATRSAREELLCRSMAANSFFSTNDTLKVQAPLLCNGYSGKEQSFCLSYAANTSNVADPKLIP